MLNKLKQKNWKNTKSKEQLLCVLNKKNAVVMKFITIKRGALSLAKDQNLYYKNKAGTNGCTYWKYSETSSNIMKSLQEFL